MLTKIWLVIELIMKLFKLWDQFADHVEARRRAEAEEKRQAREKAIEDSKRAETDDEIFDSQDRIVNNKP